ILMGPRFRIHYRDLALLARWAQHHNLGLSEAKRQAAPDSDLVMTNETEFEPQDVAYSLVEALNHLDEIEALGPDARSRLTRAREEILAMRSRVPGALLELVQSVISETGIGEALDASSREDAVSAKANLTNFLGVVASFAPISGEPSIDAFLAYLDAAEDVDETLDLGAPAAGDSVKLMTVHQAKGLEFEVVFVPCVAARSNEAGEYVDSFFPDIRTSNPMTSHSQLPPSVREDAEHLPSPWTVDRKGDPVAKKKAQFKKDLAERAIEDERRLFYVAITRAKQLLYVTAAWWYERQRKERGPSQFFAEVAQSPETEVLSADDLPELNPLQELLARQAIWPPDPARSIPSDDVFPDGYPAVIDQLIGGSLSETDLLALVDDRAEAERLLDDYRQQIASLVTPIQEPSRMPLSPVSMSATQAVALSEGSATIEQLMRPVPQRPSAARRIGTEIHRWIEEQGRGLAGLADEESLDLPSAHVEQAELEALRQGFVSMGYATRKLAQLDTGEPMAEVPFVLKIGDRLVRGRIDAVYETETQELEIVDFKTGKRVTGGPSLDQLMVYAAALVTLGVKVEGSLRLTYCYLATQQTDTRVIDAETAAAAIGELERALAGVELPL
ncbi:MAG TPA: 3'-5' exonuclease, partial [Actinomycetota bacterium]|nr:3'-5' exonuclease [Actinomycetota bacterium]